MLEKVESWINRKFAPADRPCKRTVVNWIKSGKIYGEQIGGPHGTWYVDETIPTLPQGRAKPPASTGNDDADRILRGIGHG